LVAIESVFLDFRKQRYQKNVLIFIPYQSAEDIIRKNAFENIQKPFLQKRAVKFLIHCGFKEVILLEIRTS